MPPMPPMPPMPRNTPSSINITGTSPSSNIRVSNITQNTNSTIITPSRTVVESNTKDEEVEVEEDSTDNSSIFIICSLLIFLSVVGSGIVFYFYTNKKPDAPKVNLVDDGE